MASTDLEPYKGFVLKLVVHREDEDDTTAEIRRVRFGRLLDAQTGGLSFDRLKGLALEFSTANPSFFSSGSRILARNLPHVTFAYKDVDEERIVIDSTEELLDALEQYKESGVLRLHLVAVPSPSLAEPSSSSSRGSLSSGDDNTLEELDSQEFIRKSVMDILAEVALNGTSIQEGDANCTSKSEYEHGVVEASEDSATVSDGNGAESADPITKLNATGGGSDSESCVVKHSFVHGRHTCNGCKTTPIIGERFHAVNRYDYDLCKKCREEYKGSEIKFELAEEDRDRFFQESFRSKLPTKSKIESGVLLALPRSDPPFIHGRHTCDGCSVTPIIGKRYRAVNWDDFDLCETCWTNYREKDVLFEPVELERDRALQRRWRRWCSKTKRQPQVHSMISLSAP